MASCAGTYSNLTFTANATVTKNGYDITISNPTALSLPATNPDSLGPATVNQSYNGAINASGGVGPYTWTISGNSVGSSGYSLGNGTSEAGSTGGSTLSISGTPSTQGTVQLTNVTVTDSLNTSATKTYSITVNPVSTLSLTIEGNVPQGMVSMPYTFSSLNITGGVQPYTVQFSNLPAGLAQDASYYWNVTGTPTTAGSTTVTVKVTDSTTPTPQSQSMNFTLPVVPLTVATNNSEVKGQYACFLAQNWDGGVISPGTNNTLHSGGRVFAIAVDGSGHITGGEMDVNSRLAAIPAPAKSERSAASMRSVPIIAVTSWYMRREPPYLASLRWPAATSIAASSPNSLLRRWMMRERRPITRAASTVVAIATNRTQLN